MLSIDPEFRDLLPPLTPEEKAGLTELIKRDGCRDAVVYWATEGNPIVDGHHRYDICEAEGTPYPVLGMQFASRSAVIQWIWANQDNRRNLNDSQRSYLRGKLYQETAREQAGRPVGDNGASVAPKGKTRDIVAAETGVSPRTIDADSQFAAAVDSIRDVAPEVAAAARHGDIPRTQAVALADAPKAELKKLAKAKGPKLRKAAKAAADKQASKDKPKQGAAKTDSRLWCEVEALLGKALNRTDELNKQFPHGVLHRHLIADIKNAMNVLKQWKAAVQ
ncbi:MAG: hypothetical protein A2W31_11540 [Planctomycetes bacterium RBG_16_64_10]|nr:MAG: hypothetical protein A2W31_11540 [Planctomycetes bacterium RBG_16_64_10]